VKQFIHKLLNVSSGIEINHIHALGTWHVNSDWEARGATANTTDWGTDRYTGLELIEDALNLKTPTVYDLNADKKPVVNAQATEAAREKQERIKESFKEWVWSDDSRRDRLCRLYNDTFNHTRVRTFNGEHLTLPGASSAIQLHLHQKAGVWRILQSRTRARPRRRRGQDLHDGSLYDGTETARLGTQADDRRSKSHARPVLN
jgi:N12 class adenine-specific DNA methylase